MKLLRTWLIALLVLSSSAHASISATAVNFAFSTGSATTSHTCTLPSARPSALSSIVLFFLDRTGGAVINAVADSVNGAWGAHLSTNTDGSGNVTRIYYFPASAAGTPTVTVTTNASQNSQLNCGWIVGTVAVPTFDVLGTVAVDAASNTDTDSNTLSTTAAGAIIGAIYTPTAQSVSVTMDGAGESLLIPVGAGVRAFMTFQAVAGAGTEGFEVTLGAASATVFHIVSFIEPSAGGVVCAPIGFGCGGAAAHPIN